MRQRRSSTANAHLAEAAVQTLTPRMVLAGPTMFARAGVPLGAKGLPGSKKLRRPFGHNFESVDQQTPTIQNVVTQGDTVVLYGHESGIIRSTRRGLRVETGGFGLL